MNEIEGKREKMAGNNRGPFDGQCTNCGFSWMSETWSLVCVNIELRIWSVVSFSKTLINHLQNRSVIKYVSVKVDTACYGKGSVDHKTYSSNLRVFFQFFSNVVFFFQLFSSALYFPVPSILIFPQKLVQCLQP